MAQAAISGYLHSKQFCWTVLWQLPYKYAFKQLSTLVNFYVASFILRTEEKKQHFQHILLHYFKKGKNTMETQICAVYGEGAVTEHVKSGLRNFVLDFLPMMLHSWVDQLELTVIKSRHKLINIIPCGRELTYSKHPNQALKIRTFGYVHHFDVWSPHKLSEKILECFYTYNSLLKIHQKHFTFKTNCGGHCIIIWNRKKIMGQAKWTTTKHQRPVFIQRRWFLYMVGLEGSPLL